MRQRNLEDSTLLEIDENQQTSPGDMLLEREEWLGRESKGNNRGQRSMERDEIWQNAAGQGRGLHEASGGWKVFSRGKRGSRG